MKGIIGIVPSMPSVAKKFFSNFIGNDEYSILYGYEFGLINAIQNVFDVYQLYN